MRLLKIWHDAIWWTRKWFQNKTQQVFVSVLTTAQHGDARSHIQVKRRSERVASCHTHRAAQQQELQHRGLSSLHLRQASHGTNTLRVMCIRMQWHSHKHVHPTTHIHPFTVHTPKQWGKHCRASRQPLPLCWRNLKKKEKKTHIHKTDSVSSHVYVRRDIKCSARGHCAWNCDNSKSQEDKLKNKGSW